MNAINFDKGGINDPVQVLQYRYAMGEIEEEEFKQKIELINQVNKINW